MSQISKSNFTFLKKLEKNNNRDWFKANRPTYDAALENTLDFISALYDKMQQADLIENPSPKKCMHRIYRDVRFSKDKTPYNNHWSAGFKRATKLLRGGYYIRIAPGNNTIVAGGFWNPNSDDIKRIRKEIDFDAKAFHKIFNAKAFTNEFGAIHGSRLKTVPRGYDKTHPEKELLQLKQFIAYKTYSDKEVLDPKFVQQAHKTFKKLRPFFDLFSDVLTTDENGLSLYQ